MCSVVFMEDKYYQINIYQGLITADINKCIPNNIMNDTNIIWEEVIIGMII